MGISTPAVTVNFTQSLKELTLPQLQALTEEDLTRYAMTIPSLTLLCTNRDFLIRECVDMASDNYTEANMGLRNRIMEDRQNLLQTADSFSRKSQEFEANLIALRPLSRVYSTLDSRLL